MEINPKESDIDMLGTCPDNLFTGFPQKMWKTLKNPMFLKACSIVVCLLLLSSCTYFKGSKKQDQGAQESVSLDTAKSARQVKGQQSTTEVSRMKPAPESALIDKGEEDVKKRFGEPDIVSKTPDGHIIWTYKPTWKLMPDNKGTLYVEFEAGKVIKIVRAR